MYSRPRPLPFPPSRTSPSFRSRQILTHQNQLNEQVLKQLLESLQHKLFERRGKRTDLVVHGGIISVLGYKSRSVTTDIDYIERVLPEESNLPKRRQCLAVGVLLRKVLISFGIKKAQDVRSIIKECIAETALEFNLRNTNTLIVLEHDWMNSAADVALPWHLDENCYMIDPLVISAVRSAELKGNIVFDSPGLRLIGIPPSWTFALKLQRYSRMDEDDIVCLLERDGACLQHTEDEFVDLVEQQLNEECPVMDYARFPKRGREEWKSRLRDCVRQAKFRLGTEGSHRREPSGDVYV